MIRASRFPDSKQFCRLTWTNVDVYEAPYEKRPRRRHGSRFTAFESPERNETPGVRWCGELRRVGRNGDVPPSAFRTVSPHGRMRGHVGGVVAMKSGTRFPWAGDLSAAELGCVFHTSSRVMQPVESSGGHAERPYQRPRTEGVKHWTRFGISLSRSERSALSAPPWEVCTNKNARKPGSRSPPGRAWNSWETGTMC